jgi:hypothetical protein
MIRHPAKFLLAITFCLICHSVSAKDQSYHFICGKIRYENHQPASGATVKALTNNRFLAGAVSNENGDYQLKIELANLDSILLTVSLIGFEDENIIFPADKDTIRAIFTLYEKPIELGTVVVRSPDNNSPLMSNLDHDNLGFNSKHSLVTTDPTSAIKQPQTVRQGSNHSAKIRINGTSPVYFMNGLEMGYDPTHYGMFSIVPGSVIDKIIFFPQGTNAAYGSPSCIEFDTQVPFDKGLGSELDLSFIEGTGSAFYGNKRYFLLASLRKSILDKIADDITQKSENVTIPPTDFRDIFISSGLRLSGNSRLLIDHYQVKDFLRYIISNSTNNPNGINTLQNTGEDFWSLRYEMLYHRLLIKLGAANKQSSEFYHAGSVNSRYANAFLVDLKAKSRMNLLNLEATLALNNFNISAGDQLNYVSNRQIDLAQINWNFLSPDASSDNPFMYQRELNSLYGSYHSRYNDLNNAAYLAIRHRHWGFEIESGLRMEYFQNLAQHDKFLYRNSLKYKINDFEKLEFSIGSYANNPENKILEPYQVLIHDNINKLLPVETRLTSFNFSLGPVVLGAFEKNIEYLPRVLPDFEHINPDHSVDRGFISVRSDGKIKSRGADITIETKNVFSSRLNLYAYYGYTEAQKISGQVTVPYELNAPHKIFMQLDYQFSPHFTLGGNISVRSGYRYTNIDVTGIFGTTDIQRYSWDYYNTAIAHENSEQFPWNISSNLYADFKFGKSSLNLLLSNISNYKNPIIRTYDGFVYDAGILPSIGYSYKF